MLRTTLPLALLVTLIACSDGDGDGDGGSGMDTSIGVDSTTGDTSVDTSVADTAVADTAVVDGSGDTAVGDTSTADGGDTGIVTCPPACETGRDCCDGECTNLQNDPRNCGACGTACPDGTYCTAGACVDIPCTTSCAGDETCCGTMCCGGGTICCDPQGPVSTGPTCVTPDARGTCPVGCAPLCVEM